MWMRVSDLQLVRKLLISVTAAATDPQLAEEARPFAHHMARHLAMLLAVGEASWAHVSTCLRCSAWFVSDLRAATGQQKSAAQCHMRQQTDILCLYYRADGAVCHHRAPAAARPPPQRPARRCGGVQRHGG